MTNRLLGVPWKECCARETTSKSIFPNFALEEALTTLKDKGILRLGTVGRVAVIGPGLDTINKDVGFDYYPEHTLQPFAVADSLLRLSLARENALKLTTLDISKRVNSHLRGARKRAQGGAGYPLQLPIRSNVQWKAEALRYWEQFGGAVGEKTPGLPPPPMAGEAKTRAVRIRPAIVLRVRPRRLDVSDRASEEMGPQVLHVFLPILVQE